MSAPRRLRDVQRWFLGAVLRRAASPRSTRTDGAGDVVAPSATLDPDERIDVHARMYLLRLEECLAADFQAVRAVLGARRFATVVRRYVTRHPPASWTLNDLGARFPGFVRRTRGLPRAALVADLAALERAMSESFDAEDVPALQPAAAAAAAVREGAGLRLAPHPSLRILALTTNANPAVTRIREDRPPPRRTVRRPSPVAVYRKDERVWRADLTVPMHAALSALAAGETVGEAVRRASAAFRGDPARLPDLVRAWFADWIGEGLFVAAAPERTRRRATRARPAGRGGVPRRACVRGRAP